MHSAILEMDSNIRSDEETNLLMVIEEFIY